MQIAVLVGVIGKLNLLLWYRRIIKNVKPKNFSQPRGVMRLILSAKINAALYSDKFNNLYTGTSRKLLIKRLPR